MSIVYLNGHFIPREQAMISVFDRGFMFSDSLYEVIPVFSGHPFCFDRHMERLEAGIEALGMQAGCAGIDWLAIVEQMIDKNGGGNQSIYLQLTRGVGAMRDHTAPREFSPTVFVMSNPLSRTLGSVDDLRAIAAITVEDIRWSRCDIKTTALLANVMLREQALQAGVDEAVLVRDGVALEGAASNLFVVLDRVIYTAPKNRYILAGITRDVIVSALQEKGLPGLQFNESALTEEQLLRADEIWLTSSTREIMPISQLNGRAVGNADIGPVCKAICSLYIDEKQRLIQSA